MKRANGTWKAYTTAYVPEYNTVETYRPEDYQFIAEGRIKNCRVYFGDEDLTRNTPYFRGVKRILEDVFDICNLDIEDDALRGMCGGDIVILNFGEGDEVWFCRSQGWVKLDHSPLAVENS